VNVTFLFPIGRTHVSRALREGPVLNADMESKKHMGCNLVISRYGEFTEVEGAQKKALLVHDGHFYITKDEFSNALKNITVSTSRKSKNN
jgi:hypothetical protein